MPNHQYHATSYAPIDDAYPAPSTNRRMAILTGAVIALALFGLSLLMFTATPTRADDLPAFPKLSCFVGASVGTAASATKADNGTVKIDIGGSAPLLSGEVGCYLPVGSISAIAKIRADLQRLAGDAGGTTLQSNFRYTALIGPSIAINPSVNIYGGPMLVLSKMSIKDVQANTISGYGLGAGVDMDIGKSGLRGFAEYNYLSYRGYDAAGTTVKPAESLLLVGIRFGF